MSQVRSVSTHVYSLDLADDYRRAAEGVDRLGAITYIAGRRGVPSDLNPVFWPGDGY
jgi:hypothetical protein